jgi:hypothetical protein
MDDFIDEAGEIITLKDYSTLVRSSRYIDLSRLEGKPPTKAIRVALQEIFTAMARAIEKDGLDEVFMTVFPLRLTLESEFDKWDFRIIGTLENKFSILERIAENEAEER